MNSGEIDRIPVNQLQERYEIVRSAIYTRMEALGIVPEKIGNRSYIHAEQLQLMDELHAFIQRGGTTAEFKEMRGLKDTVDKSQDMSSGLSTVQPDLIQFAAVLAAEMMARMQPQPQLADSDPFQYLRDLEEACKNGWLLKTSELAFLLDLLPSAIQQYGDSFSEAGFVFTKEGYRAGGEVAWRVSKRLK